MDFTKISNVPLLEEMPENTNAVVEVDGAFKRIPGRYLSGVTLTEFYISQEGVPEEGQGGVYVFADKTTTEPITYAEFKAAHTTGIVRLCMDAKWWLGSDDIPDDMTVYVECTELMPYDSARMAIDFFTNMALFFSDTDFSSQVSLSETKLRWRNG